LGTLRTFNLAVSIINKLDGGRGRKWRNRVFFLLPSAFLILVILTSTIFLKLPDGPLPPDEDGKDVIPRPYVQGKNIILNNSTFEITAVYKFKSLSYYIDPTHWIDESNDTYDLLSSTKINTVVLALNKWEWINNINYKPAIDKIINKIKTHGLFVILNYHANYDPTTATDYGTWTNLEEWKSFMVDLATRYKNETTVIGIDIFDESHNIDIVTWKSSNLAIIDAIHEVEPSYIIFVGNCPRTSMVGFGAPYPRKNIVYGIQHYSGYDLTGGNRSYADLYNNAATESAFNAAYRSMTTFYREVILDYSIRYDVPVIETGTSICKRAYNVAGYPVFNNSFRQFTDQVKILHSLGIGSCYFAADRDFPTEKFWSLLDQRDPSAWSQGGLIYLEALNNR